MLATTWKGEANDWIGPHLGLPELPYIEWPQMHGKAPRGTFWKITSYDHEYVEQNHLAAALLLYVDPRLGLLRPDFDALAEWATAL